MRRVLLLAAPLLLLVAAQLAFAEEGAPPPPPPESAPYGTPAPPPPPPGEGTPPPYYGPPPPGYAPGYAPGYGPGYAPPPPPEPEPILRNRVSLAFDLLLMANVAYERALTQHFSVLGGVGGMYLGAGSSSGAGGAFIFGGKVGANFYVARKSHAPKGLWVGARLSGAGLGGFASGSSDVPAFIVGAAALFGYNWIWPSQFSLGLGGGIQYMHAFGADAPIFFNFVMPAFDLNIGFAF